jgi:hypothetical protein
MNYFGAGSGAKFLSRFSRLQKLLVSAVPWLLALGLIPPATFAQSTAPRFAVTKYTIAAELFPSTHLLAANVRIDFEPRVNLTTMSFDLHSGLRVDSVKDASGKDLNFRQEGLNLSVDFLNPIPPGKASSITVKYGGALASADGSPVENLKLAYVGPEGSYLLYTGRWFPVSEYGVGRFAATMQHHGAFGRNRDCLRKALRPRA